MAQPRFKHTRNPKERRRFNRRLFGPKAPAGKESNWVPTDARRGFEVLFRLYGPEKDFFDKKWVLPDIEKIS